MSGTGIPFMVTRAMKDALRARLLTDEQIAELTPKEAHEVLSTPDSREVREFLETIVAQARAATKHLKQPGLLQMVLIHPLDDKNVVIYRYALDDADLVERMTREAVSASAAGHNVYIEGRTVRPGLNGKKRGELADTVAVFAVTVDSDADNGKAWTPTVPTSLAVETSPGNLTIGCSSNRRSTPRPARRSASGCAPQPTPTMTPAIPRSPTASPEP